MEVFLCFFAVCLWDLVEVAGAELSAAAGVPVFGASAAMEAAASPKANKAVLIRVADFFMRSPKRWCGLKRCEEYDGIGRLGRDEDHFTMGGWRSAWVLRTCHTRYPTTATFANKISTLPMVGR